MFRELESRTLKMVNMKDEIDISHLIDLVNKSTQNHSSSTLNNIVKKLS